jgi:inhibitor of KinA sporulation pathway (predicted exonuclease)
MAGALRQLGIPLAGTHHRGIDDARNIAKILPYAIQARPIVRTRS